MEQMNMQPVGEETKPVAAADTDPANEPAGKPEKGKTSFQELIRGEYREDYEKAVGQRIQAAIQQRFKNQQDYKKQLDSLLQSPGGKPGQEKDSGAARPARDYLRDHVQRVNAQAESLKKEFPGFDLDAEMANPAFVRMTSPGVGMSVKDAYFAAHGLEIQRDSMLYAAQKANERIAASVMAGASRPRENGLDPAGAANLGIDVAAMDRKTREEFRRRIRNGEKINFMDQV